MMTNTIVKQGNEIGTFEKWSQLRVGKSKPLMIYKGNEIVYPDPVKDGLKLWYDFAGMRNTDTNRATAKDLSGNGNDGTLRNFAYNSASGYDKNHLLFDGIDDYLDIPDLNLSENSTTVQVGENIYAYDGDKVVTIGEDGSMEVGGRNLRFDSNNLIDIMKPYPNTGARITTLEKTDNDFTKVVSSGGSSRSKTFMGIFHSSEKNSEYYNTKISISFDFENIGVEPIQIVGNAITGINKIIHPGFKGRVKLEELSTYDYGSIQVHFRTDGIPPHDKEIRFLIRNLKTEVGSKATDWSPAPEDFINKTNITHSPLRKLKYYNRPLVKSELLSNVEKEENKQLKEGVPVQDGLVLHYDFSQETNDGEYRGKAFDYSGNGNHGELQNFTYMDESGYIGDGLKFDGVDDYVYVGRSRGEVTKEEDFSLEAVIELGADVTTTQYIYANSHNASDRVYFRVSDGFIQSGIYNGSWSGSGLEHPVSPNEKLHASYRYKDEQHFFYIKGVEVNKIITATGSIDSHTREVIGNSTAFLHPYKSKINLVRVYNRPLTPEEIAHNYQVEKEKYNF